MSLIQDILDKLYRRIYKYKGGRIIERTAEQHHDTEVLTVRSVKNYIVTIFCKEYRYAIKYRKFYWTGVDYPVYKLFAKTQGDVPEEVKRAFEEEIFLPSLPPRYVSDSMKRRLLVEAYIDLITVKI